MKILWEALGAFFATAISLAAEPVDRHALVTRHTVVIEHFDPANPLTVGNGRFAFTVDATGLQTFPGAFENTTPLGTLSDWGWHSFPNPKHYDIDHFHFKEFPDLTGREVPYADTSGDKEEIKWLRENPHRLDLGQIGFVLRKADGSAAGTNDLTDVRQTLDLWNGEILSHFSLEGEAVDVETFVTPNQDAVAVRVLSPLVKLGRIGIELHFPYGTGEVKTADWSKPGAHETVLNRGDSQTAFFGRQLDDTRYTATAHWSAGATLTNTAAHEYVVWPDSESDALEFVCRFAPPGPANAARVPYRPPDFEAMRAGTRTHWNDFWSTGGAIDLSGSKDSRWFELERRIVLSEYLTAIQSAGGTPPAETGLTYNSWEGKFHLEMHFWHEAHFALWDRAALLENSLGFYQRILPEAEGTARKQGYAGARWPKMTSPSGKESPSPIGPFLVWEEPHPIFYAELAWRAHGDQGTLEKYKDTVFQTAEFMASYATWDPNTRRYVLGPVLQCAQERFPKNHTLNPTFELTYWRWGLETAQQWRARLGMARDEKWDAVLHDLAKAPVADGKYLFNETTPDSYTNPKWNDDHPAVVGALSFVPGPGIDRETMRHTFDWIWTNWNWPETWGWDYPMLAMCAARLGETERAVDALLLDTPKNHYGLNGNVYQRPGLTIYLPANGGLLYAAALMAAGWDGAPKRNAPGFPADGSWSVKWEGLRAAP